MDERISETREVDLIEVRDIIIIVLVVARMDLMQIIILLNGKRSNISSTIRKNTKIKLKMLVKLLNLLTLLSRIVMLE